MKQSIVKFALKIAFLEKEKKVNNPGKDRSSVDGKISVDVLSQS